MSAQTHIHGKKDVDELENNTHHETSFDDPEWIGADSAGRTGNHSRQYVKRPWMLADDGLITFRGWCGVQPFRLYDRGIEAERRLAKLGLYTVIYGEIYGPRRKIAQDGCPKPTVQPSKTIVPDDIAKGCCCEYGKSQTGMSELGLGDNEWVNELTGYAEIVRLASGRSLRLKLRLYNVEGAGRDARNEATACASWGERN